MTRSDYFVVVLSLTIGLAFGLSYGDAGSNHPTYVPPGLMLTDAALLRQDWWATSVTHYHFAFNYLVAGLESLGVLSWGLALGNVAFVAAFLWILWLFVGRLAPDQRLAAILIWALVACFVGVTDGVVSVGDSFLFSPSLQPSTVAATSTFAALYLFIERRFLAAGILLLVGGLFHMNFLVLNVLFIGVAHTLRLAMDRRGASQRLGAAVVEMAKSLAPSAVAIAALAPFIVGVAASTAQKEDAELAEFVFFDFAVPFHYRPNTYLATFWSLAGWQLLGLIWTRLAVLDRDRRRIWWAVQASLATLLWSATLLTTVVFVTPVARLFVWRLAPFAEVVGVLLFTVGIVRALHAREAAVPWSIMGASVVAVVAIARTVHYKFGIISGPGIGCVLVPMALLMALSLKALPLGAALQWPRFASLTAALGALLVALTAWQMSAPDRFNLVATTAQQADEGALYDWVLQSTSPDARFVIPPDLHGFRLFARRAIVVDLKALPFDRAKLVEWYRRLEAVSGAVAPQSMADVLAGYRTLDGARLSVLRQRYGIDYAVVRADSTKSVGEWVEVFRNRSFVVLEPKPSA